MMNPPDIRDQIAQAMMVEQARGLGGLGKVAGAAGRAVPRAPRMPTPPPRTVAPPQQPRTVAPPPQPPGSAVGAVLDGADQVLNSGPGHIFSPQRQLMRILRMGRPAEQPQQIPPGMPPMAGRGGPK